MGDRIRFHLDEHIPSDVAYGPRQRGIEVTTTAETVALLGAPDADHLAFAAREGRVLVTHDADFLRLHRGGRAHAGIVFCHAQRHSIGALVRELVMVWELQTPE